MKTKAGIFGALLLLSTATAYGLDMSSASPEPAAASPASASGQPPAAAHADQFRKRLAASGIDPDSEAGRVLERWLLKFASDPALGAGLKKWSANGDGFAEDSLSPSDRLRVLKLMKEMVSGGAKDCGFIGNSRMDFVAFAKTASPRAVEAAMELIAVMATSANSPYQQTPYAVADLVDADARLNATPSAASSDRGYPQGLCGVLALMADAVVALPEPVQERASFEVFRIAAHKKAAFQTVVADPFAYLDDVFDERQLPDALRKALPADGSRPLPFSRLTVDAQWVNKTTPADDAAFKDVFVNRRNNGVIAEAVSAAGWADFTLTYGAAPLRNQTVAGGSASTVLSTVEDATAIAVANRALTQGAIIDFPVPQPSHDGVKSRHCEIGESVPASTIFHSLKGTAVYMTCSQLRKSGQKVTTHGAWLSDYGIGWTDSINDEDGRTDAVIRNITIEGAQQ